MYFSNSSVQSSNVSGGIAPVKGFHSVMLRPDSVRRVTPPTTMIPKTRALHPRSQLDTAGVDNVGRASIDSAAFAEEASSAGTDNDGDLTEAVEKNAG